MPRGVRATGYGAAGGRRDTAARSAKQKTKRHRRLADPRVKDAMEETRKAQEALDAQMAEEARNPAVGPAEGALLKLKLEEAQAREATVSEEAKLEEVALTSPVPATAVAAKKAPAKKKAVAKAPEYRPSSDDFVMIPRYKPFNINSIPAKAEGEQWVLGNARQMLMKGYSIEHVVQTTGWGRAWFDDIPVDEEGYGLGQEEWLNSIDDGKKADGK